jgi:hypothetical protein
MAEINTVCKNLYSFIRLRLGHNISDREIARRWPMEWKSFNGLKHGKRQVPRIADLEGLSRLLSIDPAFVFEVARGVPAESVHQLLEESNPAAMSQFLLRKAYAMHSQSNKESESSARLHVAEAARVDRLEDVGAEVQSIFNNGAADRAVLRTS